MFELHKCSLVVTAIILIIHFKSALALEYIGCYKDIRTMRALPQKADSGGSLQTCQRFCQSNSTYTYFGAQFGTECFCGETYYIYGRANESQCSQNCTNNPTQKCGAAGRNSVYYDIDECSLLGYCNQNCTNSPGSFSCSCYSSGYELDLSDNITCRDVNECLKNNGGCYNKTCRNTDGSHYCECDEGYNISADGGKQCQDIDECATMNGQCSHVCNNTVGSYVCSCPDNLWLSGDGYSCKDTTVNGWKIACIVLVCILCVSLLLNIMVYTYLQFFRRKLKPDREKKSDAALKTHSYVNYKTTDGIKKHVTTKNENKLSGEVVPSSTGQHMEVTGNEGQTVPEYQHIKSVTEFDQAKDYEQLDEKDRRTEVKRQQKENNNYASLVK